GFFLNLAVVMATRAQVIARQKEAAAHERLQESIAAAHQAVRVRDDFLSIAGHELRTPPAALQLQVEGLCRQAERGTFGPLPERLLTRLGNTRVQIARLEILIGGLLDVSRIASGRLVLQRE